MKKRRKQERGGMKRRGEEEGKDTSCTKSLRSFQKLLTAFVSS